MACRRWISILSCVAATAVLTAGVAGPGVARRAPSTTVSWTGRGLTPESSGERGFVTVVCTPRQDPYVTFVLRGAAASSASIEVGSAAAEPMVKVRVGKKKSPWRYRYRPVSPIDAAALLAGGVVVTHDGTSGARLKAAAACPGARPNTPPTATLSVGVPDAMTGIVLGVVIGADIDGDTLTYSVASVPTSGSVTVDASGSFTYTPTATAREASAAGGPTSDTFAVVVSDGAGGFFVVPVTVMIAPAIAPTPTR